MKRFFFRLETVRRWRQSQRDVEERKLKLLSSELSKIGALLADLEEFRRSAEKHLLAAKVLEASQLRALEMYRLYLADEKERLEKLRAECREREKAQRARVLEAEMRLKLLENLKNRRRMEWDTAFAKEEEAEAASVFLARWSGEK